MGLRDFKIEGAEKMGVDGEVRAAEGLTEGGDDKDDEEGVQHRDQGLEESREDLGHGGQLAEDAEHAAAAQKQDEPHRHAVDCEADEGEGDDEEVKHAPAVGDEGTQPVCEGVKQELESKSESENKIDLRECGLWFVFGVTGDVHLGFSDATPEILQKRRNTLLLNMIDEINRARFNKSKSVLSVPHHNNE